MFIGAKFKRTEKGDSLIGYQEIEIVERVLNSTTEHKTKRDGVSVMVVAHNYALHCRCDDTIATIIEDELEGEDVAGFFEPDTTDHEVVGRIECDGDTEQLGEVYKLDL